jgi:N-acetylneuraminic acid mutarotase
MEARRLFHGGAAFDLHVNFQPAVAAVPADYFADAGLAFGDRMNGFTYGWDAANTAGARERNTQADQRYDTFNHTQAYGVRKWEAAVPNGEYIVRVVAGDPGYFNSVYKFDVEGVLTVDGTPTSGNRFIEGTKTVAVTDGRLTVSNSAGAVNNKIAFLEIESVGAAMPIVSVSAIDGSAGEAAGNSGALMFTRTGDLTQPLVVIYGLSGSATNGGDYVQLLGSVTIASGSASAIVSIDPIDDAAPEPAETVVATILPDAGYTVSADKAATVTITDNDASVFAAKINFQPAGSAVPSGYLVDGGQAFANRGNGLSYGWSADNAGAARDRNLSLSPDQRYDTLVHFNSKSWEVAVPNGTYSVRIVAGDAGYFDGVFKIDAEGMRVVDGTPISSARWVEGSVLVNVSDGKLTLTNGAGSLNNKVCFIEIAAANSASPIVAVSAPTTNASENGPTSRSFTLSRTGNVDQPLTVYYTIGGSATNGGDYATIVSPVTIPAGSSTTTVNVAVIDDAYVETTETVTLTLAAQSGYTIGGQSAATIRINDNDTPVGNTIAWTSRAAALIGRSEGMVAVIDRKMWVFGGYTDATATNSGRVVTYDPALNTWTQINTTMPLPASHAGVVVIGRDVYIAGGYHGGSAGSQTFATARVFKYNVDSNSWTELLGLPVARGCGAMAAIGSELHFFGGADIKRVDRGEHWALDLNNTAAGWVARASLPTLRNHLGATVLNGKIYAIGGQKGQDAAEVAQSAVEVYDPATNSWSAAASMPFGRSHINTSTITVGGRILVLGGETLYGTAVSNVTAYDPASNKWTEMTVLPGKRSSGVAAFIDGALYYSGGLLTANTWKGVIS